MKDNKIWYCTYSMVCNTTCCRCHYGEGFYCINLPHCSSHTDKAVFVKDKFLVIVRGKIEESKKLNSK